MGGRAPQVRLEVRLQARAEDPRAVQGVEGFAAALLALLRVLTKVAGWSVGHAKDLKCVHVLDRMTVE